MKKNINGPQNGSGNGIMNGESHDTQAWEDGATVDIRKVIAGLIKAKWLIILVTVLTGFGAYYYAQNEIRYYRSSGTIQVDSGTSNSSNGGAADVLIRNLGLEADRSIPIHLQLLQSRHFAERVADEVISRQVMNNGERFSILMNQNNPEIDRTPRQVVSQILNRTSYSLVSSEVNIIRITHESNNSYEAMEMPNLIMDEYIKVTNEQSRSSIRATLNFLENIMLSDVEGQLAKSEEDLELFLRDVEGGLNLSGYTSMLLDRMTSLEEQIGIIDIDMEAINRQQVNIETELDEIQPGLAEDMKFAVSARLEQLQGALADLSIERMLILNKNPMLRQNEDMEPRLRELNRDIGIYRDEIDELVTNSLSMKGYSITEAGDANQRVLELRRILTDLEIEMQRLQAMKDRSGSNLLKYQLELEGLPEEQTRLARLERSRLLNERMYTDLLARKMELALLEQSTEAGGRIFDYAQEPGSPFYPNVPKSMILGLMGGFFMSVSLVSFIALRNKEIDNIDVLKRFNISLMSVVPKQKNTLKDKFMGKAIQKVGDQNFSTSLVTLIDPMSDVAEAYRRLYNNIRYNKPDASNKVLLVTSPGESEGKSTCISNLGIAMVESGNRILLIDCDIRCPSLHLSFSISRKPGLTNYIFEDRSIDEIIVPFSDTGLDVLPAGTQAISPGAVINSAKMQMLITEMSEKYDYVLIDTPPFGFITDAAPLIKVADGVIAVCRFKQTTTPEFAQLLENLHGIRSEVMGTVLMDYDPQLASGYYARHGRYTNSKLYYKSNNSDIVKQKA